MRLPPDQHQQLLSELASVGVHASSVWDLVNGPTAPYVHAQDILVHRARATDEQLVEGLARALTDKAFSKAIAPLIAQFKRASRESARWAIGNAIAVIGFRGYEDEILQLVSNSDYGKAREMLVGRLNRIKRPSVEALLIGLLPDPELDVFAATALSHCGSSIGLAALKSLDLSARSLRARKGIPKAIARLSAKLEPPNHTLNRTARRRRLTRRPLAAG